MSGIKMTTGQQMVINWRKEDLQVFVPVGEGCRYKAIIYPAGSILVIGAVILLEEATVHCQAAGPESMETGPTKHTIRTTDPDGEKHYLLERTDDLVEYRPLIGGEAQQYKLSPQGIAKIAWSNGIITGVVLA